MADSVVVSGSPTNGDRPVSDGTDKSAGQEALVLSANYTFTRTSLIIPDKTTRAQWIAIGVNLAAMVVATPFLIGDWVRFGEKKHFIRSDKFGIRQKMQNGSIVPNAIAASVQRRVQNIINDPIYELGAIAKASF